MQTAGITFEKDMRGTVRYARIDLRRHGNNELLEDFFDSQEIVARQNDEVLSWEDAKIKLDEKHKQ